MTPSFHPEVKQKSEDSFCWEISSMYLLFGFWFVCCFNSEHVHRRKKLFTGLWDNAHKQFIKILSLIVSEIH